MKKIYDLNDSKFKREVYQEDDGVISLVNSGDTLDYRKSFDGYIGEKHDSSLTSKIRLAFNKFAALSYSHKANTFQRIFNFFLYPSPKIKDSVRFLDIGCGSGLFLSCLPSDWHREGVDISKPGVEYARDVYKLVVYESPLEDFTPQDKYDVVRASHLIEHFDDTKWFLDRCNSFLKESGSLILYTPNTTDVSRYLFGPFWYGFYDKTHKKMFNKANLERYCNQSGFELVSASTYYMGIFTGSIAWKYGIKNMLLHFIISLLYLPFGVVFSKLGYGEALFMYLRKVRSI